MDAYRDSEALPNTEESELSEEASGGQEKCVSYVSVTYMESILLGNDLSQAAADYANGTSLENGASSSGTVNGTDTSTSSSGSNAAVSGCPFPQGPAGAELREVKFEEERENDDGLIWKLGKYHRRN